MEGVSVGPKERKPRLANQRIDRSHRRGGGRRRRRHSQWTIGETVMLVLNLALLLAEVVFAGVLVLP